MGRAVSGCEWLEGFGQGGHGWVEGEDCSFQDLGGVWVSGLFDLL